MLLRDGHVVSLTPKAFDLLVYLVEHHGRLVEKSTLMAALWPDTIVEEANLAFQISALRKALDDGDEGETLIQTVPTKGYRFVGVVKRTGPSDFRPACTAALLDSRLCSFSWPRWARLCFSSASVSWQGQKERPRRQAHVSFN